MPELKNFCPAPWFHSFVHADGSIRPCCVSWDKVGDTQKGDTVASVWNEADYRSIRQQFLEGQFPAGCQSCIVKEKAGGRSRRETLIEEIENLSGLSVVSEMRNFTPDAEMKIVSLDLSLSNNCNLRCRFCGPYNSTKWIKNSSELMQDYSPMWKEIFEPKEYKVIEQDLASYRDLLVNAQYLKLIELKGGEPFLLPQHLDFLKLLIELGIAPNIELVYSTNGTVVQSEVKELFRHFKKISLTVSVDATGGLYEYIRGEHYSLERDVEKNLVFYRQIPNVALNIHFTLCAYNIFGIKDFLGWIDKLGFKDNWSLGSVAFPQPLRVSSVPKNLRLQAALGIETFKHPNIERVKKIFLTDDMGDSKKSESALVSYIRDLDRIRKTNILDHVPEFTQLMSAH